MLNRSSTVKIAPPTPGKIASPSLYQMRNDVSVADDRSTPDTFAVVNALKERRKRSITSHDETPDLPVHHAKRRRQESQQSNASTSSLPGPPMPDNLPDLSNASFALRMETPSLKRPSRPSQDTPGDWDREREGSAKRLRGEMRNNSILSSLSSSRRFAEKQTLERSQSTKRKAERSFPGKENETSQSKLQKTDTLVLQKADTICVSELAKKKPELSQSKEETVILTNGHTDNDEEVPVTSEASQTPTKSKPAVPTLKTIPSMKKSATVYSGLVSRGSFTKAHYANIVATAEDYESDRETEQKRVKQMLQDLDDSFSKEEAKSAGLTTDSATSVVATSTTSVPAITIAASTVSIATTTVTIATSTQPSVLSSLAALSQLAKSPIQETGPIQESGAASKSEESGTSATTSTSVASSPKFKPLFGPLSTTETVSSVSEAKPTGFSFGLNTTATAPVIGQSVTSSAIGQPSSLGAPPPYSFGQLTSVTSASGATTLAANITSNPVPSAALSSSSNFSFGLNQPKTQSAVSAGLTKNTTASAPSALGFSASAQAPAATTSGLTFSVAGAQPGLSSNFSSTAATTTSASTAGVLAFGQPPASLASSAGGGFSFGQIPSTLAASAGGFEQTSTSQTSSTGIGFGQTPGTASSAGGFAFGQTPSVTSSAPGFSFGQGTVTSTNSAAPSAAGFAFGQTTSTGASAPGFSFGQTSTVTTASSGGFSFGIGLSTAKPSAATNLFPTVSLAPAAGGFSFAGTAAGSAPAFGNPTSTQPSTGFAFGASTAGSTPAFSFAANPAVTTIAPSQPLQFGASTTTAAVGFSFGAGGAATTQATPFGAPASTGPAFGAAATSVAPAFGAPSGSSMFAFGAGLSGTGATASPFQANAPATPVGGFSFGQNTGSTAPSFAFGAKSASAPSFGASNPSAPTFGSTSQSGSVFGGAGTHAGVKSNTPVFGTSHSQSNTPTFGTSTNPATAFGPKSLTPTFGSSTNNNAGFSFGQQPAPNVNPFGQTTPSKQTGSAFGQTGLQSTPQQQTGSVYQFGQSGTQQASTGVKGFDFSAAAGGTGSSSGFNFSAGGTPGGFGTPSLTPTGTPTPGGFSMGSAPRPPRVMSKARRRTTRK